MTVIATETKADEYFFMTIVVLAAKPLKTIPIQLVRQESITMEDVVTEEGVPLLQARTEAQEDASPVKCSLRSCRVRGAELHECAATGCNKVVHFICYQHCVVGKHDEIELLPGMHVSCTKKCHLKAHKELTTAAGGGGQEDDSTRKGNWDSDGLNVIFA
jgi:hypothetical protein